MLLYQVSACFYGACGAGDRALLPYNRRRVIRCGCNWSVINALFVEISRAIDKRLWFLKAYLKTIA
ncbi:hypothetical protein [Nostoc sp.]|uniref:hypothetical protein n=1 Tax=Nostoc sp. TaxID=1180 RepID=UPI002FFAD27A